MLRLKKFLLGFSYWLWWIWVSVTGFGLGYIAAFLFFSIAKSLTTGPPRIGFTYFAFPTSGLTLGFIQWLVFRKRLPQAKKWILANAVSFSAGLLFWVLFDASSTIFPIFWHDYGDTIWLLSSVLGSILVWMTFRHYYDRAIGWVLISAIGLMSFFYVMYSSGYGLSYYPGHDVIGGFFTIAILGGVLAGATSGFVLLWLLPRSLSGKPLYSKGPSNLPENSLDDDRFNTKSDDILRPLAELFSMQSVLIRTGTPILLFVVSFFSLAFFWPSIPAYYENSSLETTPQEFADARELWEERQIPHYRLVAEYSHQMSYCREDVEVRDEKVVNVFEEEGCEAFGFLSVSELFDMFERFVGSEATRPPISNGCEYYYVEAVYDKQLGYPHFLQTRGILNISERKQYISYDKAFSCLLNLPPQYRLNIESVAPFP
jgi:hypothetical protein